MKTRLIGGLLLLAQVTYAQLLTFDSTGTLKNPDIIPCAIDTAKKIPIYVNPSKVSTLTANLNNLRKWPGKAGNVIFDEVFPLNHFGQYKGFLNYLVSTSLHTRLSDPIMGFAEYDFKTISLSPPAAPYINIPIPNLCLPLKTLSKPLYHNFKFISVSIPVPPYLFPIPDPYWPLKTLNKPLTNTAASPLKITINRPLYDNEIIVEHLKKTKKFYKRWDPTAAVFTELSRNFKRLSYSIDSLLTIDTSRNAPSEQPFNIDVVRYFLQLFPYRTVTDSTFDEVIAANREWIKSWLWYMGEDIRLNPFPHYDTAPFLKTTYAQKRLVEERISLLKTSVGSGVFSNFSDNEQTLTRLTALLGTINEQLTALKKDSTNSANWLTQTQKKSSVLYEGELPVSDKKKINWLVHYTYTKANDKHKVEKLTKKEKLPASVAESDQMTAVIHNVPRGTNIDLKASETPIEKLTTSAENALEPFATNFLASLQGVENIIKIISSLGLVFGSSSSTSASSKMGTNSTEILKNEFWVSTTTVANQVGDSYLNGEEFLESLKQALLFFKFGTIKDLEDYNKKHTGLMLPDTLIARQNSLIARQDTLTIRQNLLIARQNLLTARQESLKVQQDSLIAVQQSLSTVRGKLSTVQKELLKVRQELLKVQSELLKVQPELLLLIVDKVNYWKHYNFLKDNDSSIQNIFIKYPNAVKTYHESKQKFEWLGAQSVPLLEIKDFKADPVPAYRMVVKYPEDSLLIKKSKEVKYTLHIGKEQVGKTSYKKHELIRFWPAVGGAYIPAVRSYYTYDAAKGVPKEEFISHLEAIVGIKLYLGKTNIAYKYDDAQLTKLGRHYNRKRGNSILNRVFIFGGLGVTKSIFKNYCLGLGLDIIPGVSLQGGFNFIAQKSYDFDKGKIKREYEHFNRNCYWGISVDPGIITKLIPIFSRN